MGNCVNDVTVTTSICLFRRNSKFSQVHWHNNEVFDRQFGDKTLNMVLQTNNIATVRLIYVYYILKDSCNVNGNVTD